MKFRLVKRARGWQVQQDIRGMAIHGSAGFEKNWFNIRGGLWRFRFLAALHLLILRERSRRRRV